MRNETHDEISVCVLLISAAVSLGVVCSCGQGGREEEKAVPEQAPAEVEQPKVEQGAAKGGKPESGDRWSAEVKALSSDDWRMRKQAAQHLAMLGKKAEGAIPALIKALRDEDDDVRNAVSQALGAMGAAAVFPLRELIKRALGRETPDERAAAELTDDEWKSVSRAVGALKEIGPDAGGAADVVMRIIKSKCKDPTETPSCYAAHGAASDALRMMGAGAVPVLISQLSSNDPGARAEAAMALGKIGEDAAEAVPLLAKMLNGDSAPTCQAAAVALGGIGEPAIPALLAAFHEMRPMVREPAVKALIDMGPRAKQAIPELKKMLRNSKKWTRRAAEDALERIE